MSARSRFIHFATKAAMLFGALFAVSVLLAAIPSHRAPAIQSQGSQQSGSQSQESQGVDHSSMPGMDMDDAKANEARAVHDMTSPVFRKTPRAPTKLSRNSVPAWKNTRTTTW